MCRMVLYDYTPYEPEVMISVEQFCPNCSQGQSQDHGDSASHHHIHPSAFPDARTQTTYRHLQGDEAELDHLALQTALEASKLDVREGDFREVMEATELEAGEYECRMMEEVLKASFEEMPGMGVWREQSDLLRRIKRSGGVQGEGVRGADAEMEDLATRLDRLSGHSEAAGDSQRTSQAASKKSTRRPEVEQSRPATFPSSLGSPKGRKIASAASSATLDINTLPRRGERTLRSMTDRETVSSGGMAVPAPQNNLRGPRNPPSPPRSPIEAAGDLEREEELRRAKYERMKNGSDQDGGESAIGGDRMPGFENLPGGNARRSVVGDNVDEDDEEDDGSGSGETETIRRLESRSGGSRFSRRPF
ncbi:hypothetical protein NU219Hw_g3009t1 [Hortaea werneckii]